MPQKITVRLPSPEGVAEGSTATFRIPTGRRIHELFLQYKKADQDISDFLEFRLYINSQLFQRFSGVERDNLNVFDKSPSAQDDGVLGIPFDRKKLLTVAGREMTALNTGVADANGVSIKSMYMEVDIKAGATIVAADLILSSLESDPIYVDDKGAAYGAGIIPFIRREVRNAAGADSDFQISDLVNPGVNSPDKISLNRITFKLSAGVVSNLKVDRNQYTIFDRSARLNNHVLSSGVRSPVLGFYTLDTTETGQGGELIQLFGMTDFRYRLQIDQKCSITCISEYFGALTA